MTNPTFNAIVGAIAVLGVLGIIVYHLLKRAGIDLRILFYTSLAEAIGHWYDHEERRQHEGASDRRRSP